MRGVVRHDCRVTLSVGVRAWIEATFGSPVADELFAVGHLSQVTGVRLTDGRELVVKARAGVERARACIAGQLALHVDGFPCPRPISEVSEVEGMAVHAEEYQPG